MDGVLAGEAVNAAAFAQGLKALQGALLLLSVARPATRSDA
jgi:hypothetical protein